MKPRTSLWKQTSPAPLILAVIGFVAAGGAVAEVVDSAAAGFTTRNVVEVSASPERVWQALTDEVAGWWHPDHTFSTDSANMSLEARAQGCLCERLPGGGSVRHMQVVFAQPGERLVLEGGLGPLQRVAAAGAMSFTLSADPDAERPTTDLELTYQVGGYLPDGLEGWAQAVDAVLGEQLQRLERYVETGAPN